MVKKFEVELDGKKVTLEFKNPTRLDRKEWIAASSKSAKEYEKFKGKENEHLDEGIAMTDELEMKRLNGIFSLLVTKEALKSPEDFNRMSYTDLEQITAWFEESIGIKRGAEATNFSKT